MAFACSTSVGDGEDPLGEEEDTTPPVISGVSMNVGSEVAVVTWTTDEPALARVDYGTDASYGSFVQDLADFTTSHAFSLSGLTPGVEYHYKITSTDTSANLGGTDDSTFITSTDITYPAIMDIDVVAGQTSATIVWNTSEPTLARIDYGTDDGYGSFVQDLASFDVDHAMTLTGLSPATTYHFRISVADDALNITQSADELFATGTDTTGPILSSIVVSPTLNGATITWHTNEPARSRVDYGLTQAYGSFVADSATLRVDHSFTLNGLSEGTAYHFRLSSTDAASNTTQTPDATFTTDADTTPPTITNVGVMATGESTATVTWNTNEPATSRVDWGATAGYGSFVQDLAHLRTSHSLVLTGLSPDADYHFAVTSRDASLNASQTPDDTFSNASPGAATITGSLIGWQPLTLSFHGPAMSELDSSPNPFLFYRLVVDFAGPSGQSYRVHGFFDGDGNGGGSGDVWRVRFSPDEGGTWDYDVHFHEGHDVAIDLNLGVGTPAYFDGASGSFDVLPLDPGADGFYKWGRLEYVGEHYLKFRDGPFFLKGGCDSPENFLGYKGFDNTFDQPGGAGTTGLENGVHRYLPHVGDWQPGDPLFTSADTGYDSKGIIGALNYLSSRNVNSIYFLPMNLGGDGQETYPFVGPGFNDFDKTHYDISKLWQWEQVFEHAQRKGLLLHVVLNETESSNEGWLDGGFLGRQRSLFYKELVARFGHHLAVKWNLGEEIDYSPELLATFATYLQDVDPYDHPIAFHTHILSANGAYGPYASVLGDPHFSQSSIQADPWHMGAHVEKWRNDSAAFGHKWVIDTDEQTVGLTDTNADELRRQNLYDVYFSGGNIEWYFGYYNLPLGGDMRCEDFRTREEMWDMMGYARDFMQQNLPFQEMEPADELLTGEASDYGGGEVFRKHDSHYAVYLPTTWSTGTLDLSGTTGLFQKRWFNPRTGLFEGSASLVAGGAPLTLDTPPGGANGDDWVVLLARTP